jgi:hypothetical protein
MTQPVLLVVRICAFALTILVFELIRRERLKDQLGIVWLVSSILVFVLTLWPSLWVGISHRLGIFYEPSLFFLAGVMFCVGLLLYLTVMFSKHEREKEIISQHIGILQFKLDRLEKKIEKSDSH